MKTYLPSKRDLIIVSIYGFFIAFIQITAHLIQSKTSLNDALQAGLVEAASTIPIAITLLVLIRFISFQDKKKSRFIMIHLAMAFTYTLLNEFITFGLHSFTMTTAQFESYFNDAIQHWLLYSILFTGLMEYTVLTSMGYIFMYIDELKSKNQIETGLRKELKIAQLETLKSQINPHFLFNSLHNIHALIGSDQAKARKIVLLLSDYLRTVLDLQNEDFITITDEFKQISMYLDIETIRFENKLKSVIKNDIKGTRYIPTLLLQPLVENAVKHGVSSTTKTCLVDIHAFERNDQTVIRIYNDHVNDAVKDGHSIGLKNTEQRLKTNFADDYQLTITNSNGYSVEIIYPSIKQL